MTDRRARARQGGLSWRQLASLTGCPRSTSPRCQLRLLGQRRVSRKGVRRPGSPHLAVLVSAQRVGADRPVWPRLPIKTTRAVATQS